MCSSFQRFSAWLRSLLGHAVVELIKHLEGNVAECGAQFYQIYSSWRLGSSISNFIFLLIQGVHSLTRFPLS